MTVPAPDVSPHPARVPNEPRVLLIEDTDATRQRISATLRTHGYNVVEACDGRDALQKVSQGPFDTILLDLILPNVDGWQFRAAQLRHPELATIPTVVVTVKPLREVDRYVLRVTNVVRKPFEDADLLATVRLACAESPRQAALAQTTPSATLSAADVRLYWSRRGEIACAHHVPERGSPRWADERWTPLREGRGKHGIVYQCQHCPGQVGRPIRHQSRGADDE